MPTRYHKILTTVKNNVASLFKLPGIAYPFVLKGVCPLCMHKKLTTALRIEIFLRGRHFYV